MCNRLSRKSDSAQCHRQGGGHGSAGQCRSDAPWHGQDDQRPARGAGTCIGSRQISLGCRGRVQAARWLRDADHRYPGRHHPSCCQHVHPVTCSQQPHRGRVGDPHRSSDDLLRHVRQCAGGHRWVRRPAGGTRRAHRGAVGGRHCQRGSCDGQPQGERLTPEPQRPRHQSPAAASSRPDRREDRNRAARRGVRLGGLRGRGWRPAGSWGRRLGEQRHVEACRKRSRIGRRAEQRGCGCAHEDHRRKRRGNRPEIRATPSPSRTSRTARRGPVDNSAPVDNRDGDLRDPGIRGARP